MAAVLHLTFIKLPVLSLTAHKYKGFPFKTAMSSLIVSIENFEQFSAFVQLHLSALEELVTVLLTNTEYDGFSWKCAKYIKDQQNLPRLHSWFPETDHFV